MLIKKIPAKPANICLFCFNWPNDPGIDLALISSGGNATSRLKPAGVYNLPSQPLSPFKPHLTVMKFARFERESGTSSLTMPRSLLVV